MSGQHPAPLQCTLIVAHIRVSLFLHLFLLGTRRQQPATSCICIPQLSCYQLLWAYIIHMSMAIALVCLGEALIHIAISALHGIPSHSLQNFYSVPLSDSLELIFCKCILYIVYKRKNSRDPGDGSSIGYNYSTRKAPASRYQYSSH